MEIGRSLFLCTFFHKLATKTAKTVDGWQKHRYQNRYASQKDFTYYRPTKLVRISTNFQNSYTQINKTFEAQQTFLKYRSPIIIMFFKETRYFYSASLYKLSGCTVKIYIYIFVDMKKLSIWPLTWKGGFIMHLVKLFNLCNDMVTHFPAHLARLCKQSLGIRSYR